MRQSRIPHAQEYRAKNVLITGGLGFIGSNLAHILTDAGANVTIIDSLEKGCGGNLHNIADIQQKVRVIIADMNDTSKLIPALAGAEIVFNLAGNVSHTESMKDPATDARQNLTAHLTLLETCRRMGLKPTIIYTGTRGQYGATGGAERVSENHPMHPLDINGIHKLAAEQYHQLYYRVHGIPTVCLRLTNTFGPRQSLKNNTHGFLPWFLRTCLEKGTIEIWGDGKGLRDITYVADVCEALLLAGLRHEAHGEVYNVGSGQPLCVLDAAQKMTAALGGTIKLIPYDTQHKKIEVGDYVANIDKIKALGWWPRTTFEQALEETASFYKKELSHYV